MIIHTETEINVQEIASLKLDAMSNLKKRRVNTKVQIRTTESRPGFDPGRII
jgi:hypothetical protein